ncbi:MAG: stage V sporulation protein AD [Bacilli bacterium]|nr:stage V sporulation protein AD [Bacilli bacterium]
MTFKYKNVYINDTATVIGPDEKKGPLNNYFDKSYDELYLNKKTFEQAEIKMIEDSLDILFSKIQKTRFDIDLFISGDLLNQITSSNYVASNLKIPYLGIYNACATSVEGLIIGANMLEKNQIKNCICNVSSHNATAEKQFRYPVEYGGPKPKTTTFTVTGAASAYLSNNPSNIKIESATIGRVIDMGINDVYNMGAVMAPACADTLYYHLIETKRDIDYYDLVLSGDLGKYGKRILINYMKTEYGIILKKYDDTATIIFDLNEQNVYAGGSGPACAPLVTYGYIFSKMRKKELKKVLLLATGALMSSTMVNQKMTIPAIAHAISLEAI